jgi:hypothetical protein
MMFIPVRQSHYEDAVYEAGECLEGTRVLAWVNYLKEIGIKRYYICEKYCHEWYYITVDVFPHDTTVWWDLASRDALERDSYVNASCYDDDSVVIWVDQRQEADVEDIV